MFFKLRPDVSVLVLESLLNLCTKRLRLVQPLHFGEWHRWRRLQSIQGEAKLQMQACFSLSLSLKTLSVKCKEPKTPNFFLQFRNGDGADALLCVCSIHPCLHFFNLLLLLQLVLYQGDVNPGPALRRPFPNCCKDHVRSLAANNFFKSNVPNIDEETCNRQRPSSFLQP